MAINSVLCKPIRRDASTGLAVFYRCRGDGLGSYGPTAVVNCVATSDWRAGIYNQVNNASIVVIDSVLESTGAGIEGVNRVAGSIVYSDYNNVRGDGNYGGGWPEGEHDVQVDPRIKDIYNYPNLVSAERINIGNLDLMGKPDLMGRQILIGAAYPDLGGPIGLRQRYSGYTHGWRR